jgi:hypothetical protein
MLWKQKGQWTYSSTILHLSTRCELPPSCPCCFTFSHRAVGIHCIHPSILTAGEDPVGYRQLPNISRFGQFQTKHTEKGIISAQWDEQQSDGSYVARPTSTSIAFQEFSFRKELCIHQSTSLRKMCLVIKACTSSIPVALFSNCWILWRIFRKRVEIVDIPVASLTPVVSSI